MQFSCRGFDHLPITSHQSPFAEGRIVNPCRVIDLGLIGYAEAYALQKRVVAARKACAMRMCSCFASIRL